MPQSKATFGYNITGEFDSTALRKMAKEFDSTADKLDGRTKTMSSKFKDFANSLTSMQALVAGAMAGTAAAFIGSTVKAYAEAEKQTVRLRQTVEASGKSWTQYGKQIEETVRQQSMLGAFDDELISSTLSRLIQATQDVTTAEKLNAVAMDVSRGTGKDLEAVAVALGKAYNGNQGALSKLGIQIDKTASFQENLNRLMQIYQGQAALYGDTTAGSIDRLTIATQNLKEAVGKLLVDGAQLPKWMQLLSQTIEALANKDWKKVIVGLTALGNPSLAAQVAMTKDKMGDQAETITILGRVASATAEDVKKLEQAETGIAKAHLAALNAGRSVATARENLARVVKKYGENSLNAKIAQLELDAAMEDAKKSANDYAKELKAVKDLQDKLAADPIYRLGDAWVDALNKMTDYKNNLPPLTLRGTTSATKTLTDRFLPQGLGSSKKSSGVTIPRASRMNDSFLAALEGAIAAARTAGGKVSISDTYRSYAEQLSAYRRKPGLALDPRKTTSLHQKGLAADMTVKGISQSHWESILAQFGLMTGSGWKKSEPWHVQWASSSSYSTSASVKKVAKKVAKDASKALKDAFKGGFSENNLNIVEALFGKKDADAALAKATKAYKVGKATLSELVNAKIAAVKATTEYKKALNAETEAAKKATQEAAKVVKEFKASMLKVTIERDQALREGYTQHLKDVDRFLADMKAKAKDLGASWRSATGDMFSLASDASDGRTGDQLYFNLNSKLQQFRAWTGAIGALIQRGVPKAFIDELIKLGPGYQGDVTALANMTEADLKSYTALWSDYADQSESFADYTLSDETRDGLSDLHDAWVETVTEIRASASGEFEAVRDAALDAIKAIEDMPKKARAAANATVKALSALDIGGNQTTTTTNNDVVVNVTATGNPDEIRTAVVAAVNEVFSPAVGM